MGKAPIRRTRTLEVTPEIVLHTTVPAARKEQGIRRWAHPVSLAVTQGILVSFFSSP